MKTRLYNLIFKILHRNDEHVVVWNRNDDSEDLIAAGQRMAQHIEEIESILDFREMVVLDENGWFKY